MLFFLSNRFKPTHNSFPIRFVPQRKGKQPNKSVGKKNPQFIPFPFGNLSKLAALVPKMIN
jgi:hypothetical protein